MPVVAHAVLVAIRNANQSWSPTCSSAPPVIRDMRPRHALAIVRPALLGQEEPQARHHSNLARRQSERDQRPTVGGSFPATMHIAARRRRALSRRAVW